MKPLIRWAGGKQRLVKEIWARIPSVEMIDLFVEPFAGAAAVTFHNPRLKLALLSDVNAELINFFNVVKATPLQLAQEMALHRNEEAWYYQIREMDRTADFLECDDVVRAGRFWYLNQAAFNGLWRVNGQGFHNVPFAKPPKKIKPFTIDELFAYSHFMANMEFKYQSFEQTALLSKPGVFYYLDPPYVPISRMSSFTDYSANGFNLTDQKRLVEFCHAIVETGGAFLLSNSDCDVTRDLYKGFKIDTVTTRRSIGCNVTTGRNVVTELLVSGAGAACFSKMDDAK